jgi:ribonuclease P protein component
LNSSDNSNRFPKSSRLLNAAAYGRVFAQAARSRDKLFTVLYRRNTNGAVRLGMAISKKNCRHATVRNRIKRAVRESFRQHTKMLSGLDIVVLNSTAAAAADGATIRKSLGGHWQRCAKAIQQQQQES